MRPWTYAQTLALGVSLAALLTALADPVADDAQRAELRRKPITTAKGELGDLLRKWWQDGTAAGNIGDFYDNRDRGHSDLNTGPYPQLQRIVYSDDDRQARRDWALTVGTRPHVTFGNSSTSAPPTLGGSNPRHAYCFPQALRLLDRQYRGNNVYIHPEHRDHDPGQNGMPPASTPPDLKSGEGYGDLYPTNSPYLFISQGSSGSDQPFMRAIPFTLAAFRPEVKQKLVENGLLMPTVQMLLRSTGKQLREPKEYLTGKAHPSVFEGAWVDALAMVKQAHEITADTIPPLVQLRVIEEEIPVNGRDYFDPSGVTEKLADTPAVIARVWRGKAGKRRLIVSAANSFDVNKKPLSFTWVALRGDDKQIQIVSRNESGSEVEIVVPYPTRRPVAPGSALESNRIDIGVFAHNGTYYSAPAFVTFFGLDNESRAYNDQGRLLEIAYGAGTVEVRVSNLPALVDQLAATSGLVGKVFRLTDEQRSALTGAVAAIDAQQKLVDRLRAQVRERETVRAKEAAALKQAQAALAAAQKAHAEKTTPETQTAVAKATKQAEDAASALQQADAALKASQKEGMDGQRKLDALLTEKQPVLDASVAKFLGRVLRQVWQDPNFFDTHREAVLAAVDRAEKFHRAAFEAARQQLLGSGLARDHDGRRLDWQPLRKGSSALAERLTPYEIQVMQRFNASLLASLILPGSLTIVTPTNYVDQRLFAAKAWRDVYHYDRSGKVTGWTRRDAGRTTQFTEEGLMVLEKDGMGRPIKARSVSYTRAPPKGNRPGPLEMAPGDEIVTFAYEGEVRVEKSRIKPNSAP